MIWLKLKGYAAALGVALTIIVGAFFYGRSDGKAAARAEQAKADARARNQAKEVENEINGLGSGDVDDRLSKWMRDGGR